MSDVPIYFRFFIDDYLRDAEELSLMRHGAYLRLMLWYYARAKPIPNDLFRIYQRVGARSKDEEEAVKWILGEFFMLDQEVWKHKRIESELTNWRSRSDEARAAAASRWKTTNENKERDYAYAMRPLSERNANQNQNQNQRRTKIKSLVASRLPSGWQLPEEWQTFAMTLKGWNEEQTLRESLVFRDYWLGKAGKDGTKVDWLATWRNWVRRSTR